MTVPGSMALAGAAPTATVANPRVPARAIDVRRLILMVLLIPCGMAGPVRARGVDQHGLGPQWLGSNRPSEMLTADPRVTSALADGDCLRTLLAAVTSSVTIFPTGRCRTSPAARSRLSASVCVVRKR